MKVGGRELKWSLWHIADGNRYVVSLSLTGPGPGIGNVGENPDGTWSIEGDANARKFQDAQEAIRTLVAESAADAAGTQEG